MNIHPLFVHFPIALLTVYALMEIIWYKKLTTQDWWWKLKAMLLVLGTIGGFLALQTGELAEELRGNNSVIEIHSTYATITVWIFSIILFSYIVTFIEQHLFSAVQPGWQKTTFTFAQRISFFVKKIAPLLAGVGLITLIITGAIGGALVYGPDADPVVHFIYSLVVGV